MWASINVKLLRQLDRFQLVAVTHPVQCIVYVVLTALFAILSIHFVYRKQSDRAFWCVIGLILTDFAFSSGEDTPHHVYRIAAISEQLRHGNLSLLLTNPTTGEAFPIFVYYSFLPYLLPVALNLAGVSALVAFKTAMGLQLVVLAVGLQALINQTSLSGNHQRQTDMAFLIAILFVSANYVYGLWHTRAAFADIWVYSLIPWVVISILSPRSARSLTALFFIQICAHPLVFAQSFVCELAVVFGFSRVSIVTLGRRCLMPLAIALVFASPFWLPQLLWMRFILGNAALPARFSDTFLSIGELLDPRFVRNIGLWLPLAVALMIAASRARLPVRVWALVSAFVVLVAMQTVYLRTIATHIPLLDQSQFVWRLMLASAFIAFGALVAGWRVLDMPAGWALAPLALLSAIGMVLIHVLEVPGNIAAVSVSSSDSSISTEYLRTDNVWGVLLFAPNYSQIPRNCDAAPGNEMRNASFSELRTGVTADRPFIAVRNGPIGFVEYNIDGAVLPPSACRDELVLGPLTPNGTVRVAEDRLSNLLYLRVVGLVAGLLGILLLIPFGRFRPAAV